MKPSTIFRVPWAERAVIVLSSAVVAWGFTSPVATTISARIADSAGALRSRRHNHEARPRVDGLALHRPTMPATGRWKLPPAMVATLTAGHHQLVKAAQIGYVRRPATEFRTGADPGGSAPSVKRHPTLPNRGSWPNPYHLVPQDIFMIARLVQAEAGDQPFLGQVAVAAVVLNRLRSSAFPKTVPAIIFAPGQFETVAAGTYWNSPSPVAMLAARAAAAGWDPADGAVYFYNPALPHAAWMNRLPTT